MCFVWRKNKGTLQMTNIQFYFMMFMVGIAVLSVFILVSKLLIIRERLKLTAFFRGLGINSDLPAKLSNNQLYEFGLFIKTYGYVSIENIDIMLNQLKRDCR